MVSVHEASLNSPWYTVTGHTVAVQWPVPQSGLGLCRGETRRGPTAAASGGSTNSAYPGSTQKGPPKKQRYMAGFFNDSQSLPAASSQQPAGVAHTLGRMTGLAGNHGAAASTGTAKHAHAGTLING